MKQIQKKKNMQFVSSTFQLLGYHHDLLGFLSFITQIRTSTVLQLNLVCFSSKQSKIATRYLDK
jgi:hypothetical protein